MSLGRRRGAVISLWRPRQDRPCRCVLTATRYGTVDIYDDTILRTDTRFVCPLACLPAACLPATCLFGCCMRVSPSLFPSLITQLSSCHRRQV